MSSLQQSIERRRAAEPAAITCVDVSAQPTLVLAIWQGKQWALPWTHFQHASLTERDGRGELVLSFTHHHVTVSGENLHKLWEDVVGLRVARLRDLPPHYQSRVGREEPFIAKIEIRPPTDSVSAGAK